MNVKRSIAIVLILMLALSLFACNSNNELSNRNDSQTGSSNVSAKDTEVTITSTPSSTLPPISEAKVVTRSLREGERVAMYYEPTETIKLKGEYFNGVPVNILEYVSDEWAKVDITTFGDGGYGYIKLEDLAFGSDGDQVEKNTLLYESAAEYFILSTAPIGQSGDIGPFGIGESVEVLGFMVPSRTYEEELEIKRPLVFEECTLHVKIGDVTGFLLEPSVLR